MKRILLGLLLMLSFQGLKGQDLQTLFEKGRYKEIVDLYNLSERALDQDELQIVAGAYDRFGRLFEEGAVLSKLFSSFPFFLTYGMPADVRYHANLIKAGLMEKHKATIATQYLRSIKDTALGRDILNAFYRDQVLRFKLDDIADSRKHGTPPRWDSLSLMKTWAEADAASARLIARVIRENAGFPPKSRIGLIGTFSLFILMQHLPVAERERYDKVLFRAACNNDITMTDYAMYRTMTLVRSKRIPDSLFQRTLDSLADIRYR